MRTNYVAVRPLFNVNGPAGFDATTVMVDALNHSQTLYIGSEEEALQVASVYADRYALPLISPFGWH